MYRCSSWDCNSVSTHLPCSLSKSLLKHSFLDIYLAMFFGAGNSGNTSAMNVICFFPYSLSKGKLKDGFLDIYLTMFFGAGISGNTSTSSFFEKCLKFNIDFKNEKKNWKTVCFGENFNWIGCIKLCLLSRELLSSAVSVLKNSLTILYINKRDFLKGNYLQSV